ncbi:MAG: tyrosine-type recombinase/integrase [Actinomycetota bacterium]
MLLERFLVDEWLPAIKTTIRPSTWAGYEGHVRLHIVPRLGHLRLDRIGPAELNALYAELLESGKVSGRGGLAPGSVRHVHVALHRSLRDAVRWGYLTSNPAERSDPPKTSFGGNHMRTWTAEQLASFLAFTKDSELYELWLLLAMTGMRRGEALGVRSCDVDLDRGELAVRQTVIEVSGKIVLSTPKTARGRRVIALDPGTAIELRPLAAGARNESLLFHRNGEPLEPSQVSHGFARLVKRSGLPWIRLHDLRHTHATLALEAGVHPKIVSERLGHSTVSFTLDVYSHAIRHLQTEAAEKIAGLIRGDGGLA